VHGGFTPTPPSPIEGEGICWLYTSINDLPLSAGEGGRKGGACIFSRVEFDQR
jgi:hypothetical protein